MTDSGRSGPSVSSQGADGVSKAWKNMNSITDQGDLDSFLQTAVLSERQFTAEVFLSFFLLLLVFFIFPKKHVFSLSFLLSFLDLLFFLLFFISFVHFI